MIYYIIININVRLLLLYNYTNHVSLNHSIAYIIFNDSQRVTTITAELLQQVNIPCKARPISRHCSKVSKHIIIDFQP